MLNISDFGINCFDSKEIKKRLTKIEYEKYQKILSHDEALDENLSSIIAEAMKNWAIEKGATHYCHWFQPLSDVTAEKHESFIENIDNTPIMKLSSKSLIKGEPDASSFPNGGLRSTFEARGYSYWDYSSPSFIKGNVLYIPSIFISYHGDSLDYKLPLLNSIKYISQQAKNVLRFLDENDNSVVTPVLGLEQEFFLINLDDYLKRRDLQICGRTLIGDLPPKTQETNEHYLGVIPQKVQSYLNDVNQELWRLGIYAKTEHNEVAPCQFEICPIFSEMNTAIDQNLIIMNTLSEIAYKHNLVCLLHEKPFKGINGSGKHNNYSLLADSTNLFSLGNDDKTNLRFLLFLCAFIKAIDENAPLIRLSSSSTGNDYRLGANEAPPGIISIYLGEDIENLLDNLINNKTSSYSNTPTSNFNLEDTSSFPKDNSDRNRTSPIAFTGNKFEFRMLGSSLNASFLNTIINLSLGSSLEEIISTLSKETPNNKKERILEICRTIIKEHNKIVFNGDGYSKEWLSEAKKRKLPNIKKFHEAIPYLTNKIYSQLLNKENIYNTRSLNARMTILYEKNNNIIHIEARTLAKIIEQDYIPAISKELEHITAIKCSKYLINKSKYLASTIDNLHINVEKLKKLLTHYTSLIDLHKQAVFLQKNVVPLMEKIRGYADKCEKILNSNTYPYPNYEKLFFNL